MSLSPLMALRQIGADQVNYWATFPISSSNSMEITVPPNPKGENVLPPTDDAPMKVRKPYTITKQRERWTEEEHQKFLDALKLYGRAWRRIEEHIGTKTAVQIRSHAQKFFSKLEREASLGGSITSNGSGEIEIPPPRPKRKPSHPYPKKASGTLSNSPSFEEDNKWPPAVCSAFSPLENSSGATKSSLPSKKTWASTASLRLFGQTVVRGTDKVEADNELMESIGSPRSQISMGTEYSSGISPVVGSNPASNSWDRSSSLTNLNEPATVDSKSQLLNGSSEWQRSSLAAHGPDFLGGYCLAQPIPAVWQGFVPPHFVHDTKDDANTAAAIAAATYAIASAWQAIQGALITNATNDIIVYNPTAILAAAGKPISLSKPLSPPNELLPQMEPACPSDECRNEIKSPPVNLEESTAECCSSLTDSSRFSSYESNDEMIPAKKRQRKLPFCNKPFDSNHGPRMLTTVSSQSKDPGNCQKSNTLAAVDLSAIECCVHARQNLSVEAMQPVGGGNLETSALDLEQPCNSMIEAFAPNSSTESEEELSSKTTGLLEESNDLDKESAASFLSFEEIGHKSGTSNECQGRAPNTQFRPLKHIHTKGGEHLFALKAGATSSRYSGVGFVPYRKFMTSDSASKH